MKLRTELKDGDLMVDDVFIDPENIEWYQASKVSHDARAAHAYRQAVQEHHSREWLEQRADALMASWGVEQDVAG